MKTFAVPELMNEAADYIEDTLIGPSPGILVHCAFGMERSPLTVMWYLMRFRDMSFSDAFKLVKSKRDITVNRIHWLPDGWEEVLHAGRHVS